MVDEFSELHGVQSVLWCKSKSNENFVNAAHEYMQKKHN